MKYLLTLFILVAVGFHANSQAPESFKYQAVVRSNGGTTVTNQLVGVRISILQNSSGGTVVFEETHGPTTNSYGHISINIGGGTVQTGVFNTIDWGGAIYFLKVEIDPTGGTSYSVTGATQLLSVPYALNAKTVSGIDWTDISNVPADIADGDDDTNTDVLAGLACSPNEVAMWNGSNWVCTALPNSTSGQFAGDAYGNAQMVLGVANTTYQVIPGLTQNITVPANAKVFVHTYGGCQAVGTGTNYAIADFAIYVDGNLVGAGGQQQVVAANTSGLANMLDTWSLAKTYTLSAGAHTVEVRAKDGGGSLDMNVSGTNGLIQGVLSVLIINE